MNLVTAPDERLRIKTKPVKKVTPQLQKTISEMIKLTKTFQDPEGVGLAATQIGGSEQYFILKRDDGSFKAIFNPSITTSSKKTKKFFEGCLSVPNFYGEVERPIGVTVSYTNNQGEKVEEKLSGMEAWIFQHELDHLNGVLFIDHVLTQKSRLYKVVGRDRAGAEIFEEVTLQI